jgi:sigma-70-like protein
MPPPARTRNRRFPFNQQTSTLREVEAMPRPTRFDWLFRPQVADVDLPLSAEARFAEALAELPAVERSALALSEIGGLDTAEIAERLGTDPAVVSKLLARARDSVRVSLATRGRRGLTALVPVQTQCHLGSSAPTLRAAGLVAAAVVAPTVAIGGAGADAPHPGVSRSEALVVRATERSQRGPLSPSRARISLARPVPTVAAARRPQAAERNVPSVRPVGRIRTRSDALPAAPGQPAPHPERTHEHTPAKPPPSDKPEPIVKALPLPERSPAAPLAPPVELPVVPSTVPALSVQVPLPAPTPPPLPLP